MRWVAQHAAYWPVMMLLHARTRCSQAPCANLLKREVHGPACSPALAKATSSSVLVRYIYDGGVLRHGRLCTLEPASADMVTGEALLSCLEADGVDLSRFEAFAYESNESGGGWLRVTTEDDDPQARATQVPLVPMQTEVETQSSGHEQPQPRRRRIDVKLFVRSAPSREAALAAASSRPSGDLPLEGFFGVGVYGAKTERNVGTLWRSAFQLGSSFIFTVGHRYRAAPTDTLKVPLRVPYHELDDWAAFVEFAPVGATWVAVEMGGEDLVDFEHPANAVYLLGSEDNGLPEAIVNACHRHVALPSERYDSYNVAAAGSIVMYDRIAKQRQRRQQQK